MDPQNAQYRYRVSPLTLSYSIGLILFSLCARDLYSWLNQTVGREILSAGLWLVFATGGALALYFVSHLRWQRIGALLAVLLIATVYAGSFEIIEERTHLIKYGTLAVFLCRDNSQRPILATACVALCGVLLVAVCDETVQSFTPGRVGDLRDVGFDLIGGVFGIALWGVVRSSGGRSIAEVGG